MAIARHGAINPSKVWDVTKQVGKAIYNGGPIVYAGVKSIFHRDPPPPQQGK